MLQGKLSDFNIPDIFQLIALTRKTGTLTVTVPAAKSTHETQGRVEFREGAVSYAVADTRRTALGARLVAAGLVSEEQLVRVLEAHRKGGASIARALLEDSILDEAALDAFIRGQISDAVFDLMRLEEAGFSFDASSGAGAVEGITLSTGELVAEGMRRLEEWALIRERIPSLDAVLAVAPQAAAAGSVTLTSDQWRTLALIDGRRSVHELVELTGAGEFATSRVLASMVSDGLLETTGESTDRHQLLTRGQRLRKLEEMELSPGSKPSDQKPDGANGSSSGTHRSHPTPVVQPDESIDDKPWRNGSKSPSAAGNGSTAMPGQSKPHSHSGSVAPAAPAASEDDRAGAARELASLGGDTLPNRRQPAQRSSLTRDASVDRGTVDRLIDGVKGA